MGAITAAPTPPKTRMGIGFWKDFDETLKTVVASFTDDTSNGTTANTIAELQTYVTAVLAALDA
jgi:hypothetical protein